MEKEIDLNKYKKYFDNELPAEEQDAFLRELKKSADFMIDCFTNGLLPASALPASAEVFIK